MSNLLKTLTLMESQTDIRCKNKECKNNTEGSCKRAYIIIDQDGECGNKSN